MWSASRRLRPLRKRRQCKGYLAISSHQILFIASFKSWFRVQLAYLNGVAQASRIADLEPMQVVEVRERCFQF